jgi:hypothetical protein
MSLRSIWEEVASRPGCVTESVAGGLYRLGGPCRVGRHLCGGGESFGGCLQDLVSASLLAEPWLWARGLSKTLLLMVSTTFVPSKSRGSRDPATVSLWSKRVAAPKRSMQMLKSQSLKCVTTMQSLVALVESCNDAARADLIGSFLGKAEEIAWDKVATTTTNGR